MRVVVAVARAMEGVEADVGADVAEATASAVVGAAAAVDAAVDEDPMSSAFSVSCESQPKGLLTSGIEAFCSLCAYIVTTFLVTPIIVND